MADRRLPKPDVRGFRPRQPRTHLLFRKAPASQSVILPSVNPSTVTSSRTTKPRKTGAPSGRATNAGSVGDVRRRGKVGNRGRRTILQQNLDVRFEQCRTGRAMSICSELQRPCLEGLERTPQRRAPWKIRACSALNLEFRRRSMSIQGPQRSIRVWS